MPASALILSRFPSGDVFAEIKYPSAGFDFLHTFWGHLTHAAHWRQGFGRHWCSLRRGDNRVPSVAGCIEAGPVAQLLAGVVGFTRHRHCYPGSVRVRACHDSSAARLVCVPSG